MTDSDDHVLGRFPRNPLPLRKEMGVGAHAQVDAVPSPRGNLNGVVSGGDEETHVGVPAFVGLAGESEFVDGGTPDPGSPVVEVDGLSTPACDHGILKRQSDRAIDLLRRALDAAPRVGCVCPWDEDGTPIGEHSQMCGSFIGVFKEIQDFLRELDEDES